MTYTFTEKLFKQGNRYFIKIPFNVWEKCGQKGMVAVRVYIEENCTFECKLVPKGEGTYYIPIRKNVIHQINSVDALRVAFEVISGLTRINCDSPYSKENPIRKIDSIQSITYPKTGYCGQLCIAMLTGLSVDEVVAVMQTKAWGCSFTKLLETLDYFGILHDDKPTYTKGKEVILPECCILNIKDEQKNHFVLYYKGIYYDSKNIDYKEIISYMRIFV